MRATTVFRTSSTWVIAGAVVMALASIGLVTTLQDRARSSRDAQVELGHIELEFTALQSLPYDALDAPDASAQAAIRRRMTTLERRVQGRLTALRRNSSTSHLVRLEAPLRANLAVLERIRGLAVQRRQAERDRLGPVAGRLERLVARELARAGADYRQRAVDALRLATIGSAAAILTLVSLFGIFYLRSRREHAAAQGLAEENARLLAGSRDEALTDALTGLRNRRALSTDLEAALRKARESVLALFDLDGFKAYNDTFGHPAGDALLARLSGRLAATMEGLGTAYRIGGDEFCILAAAGPDGGEEIARRAARALSEEGDGFRIGCSHGRVLIPSQADTPDRALKLVDQRMYGQKASGRVSASRQSTDVLLTVLAERNDNMQEQARRVADLVQRTAQALGFPESEVLRTRAAAELHDIGKIAIPDTILHKAGELDEDERRFMRCHTAIGERIVSAAPSLAHTAELVRASHEWLDGTGYPDGLAGDEIPFGARVIAVCNAYDAMVQPRGPHREPVPPDLALEELRRCAGAQFDPEVVAAFVAAAAGNRPSHAQSP
jgi:diguanylate cyclase (GGDEF)-like protein